MKEGVQELTELVTSRTVRDPVSMEADGTEAVLGLYMHKKEMLSYLKPKRFMRGKMNKGGE